MHVFMPCCKLVILGANVKAEKVISLINYLVSKLSVIMEELIYKTEGKHWGKK